jgi:type I restriction enzyme, S subunit
MVSDSQIAGAIKTFDWTDVPPGWRFDLLGNVCRVRRGASPRPAGDPRFFVGNIPWFKIGDATRSGSRYLSKTEEFVNEVGASHSVKIPAGSLIVSNSGVSLGFAVITKVEGCIHDGWLLLENFNGAERDYLYYCINYFTPRIRRMADGTTQPNLNTGIARQLLLPLPPPSEQQAIARTLGTLDDKIELNRRMNETLEAMARALFKSWFVDFDPVRAKAEKRQPAGMDAESAALFPPSFEESPFGPIPKHWKLGKFAELATLNRAAINPNQYPEEVFDHFSIPAYDEGMMPKQEVGGQIMSNKFLVVPNCVLLSKLNPRFPRVWLPDLSAASHQAVCSTEFLVLISKAQATREWIYALVSSGSFSEILSSLVTGTSGSHQRVKPEHLFDVKTVIPPEAIIRSFTKMVKPIFAMITQNLQQSRTLAALRDALLPKLLSGEIRVREAEREVEQVA